MGKKMKNPPKIFHVNWFGTDSNGKFLWPGFGENLRVLEWIIERCQSKTKGNKTPIGFIPEEKELDLTGLKLSDDYLDKLLSVNKAEWREELKSQKEFLDTFGKDLPREIWAEYEALRKRLV